MNKLYFGDNIDILRKMEDETVDLICTDPPFNCRTNYSVSFGNSFSTKIEALNNSWKWDKAVEKARVDIEKRAAECQIYKALNKCLSGYDLVLQNAKSGNKGAIRAYLTFMGPRLVEMYRILNKTGSIYLQSDPDISHYLKVLMDAIWNHNNRKRSSSFKNEIVWYYRRPSNVEERYRKMHDILLFYTKTENYVFTTPKPIYENAAFHQKAVVDLSNEKPVPLKDDMEQYKRIRTRTDDAFLRDVWDDIGILPSKISESLGYPTQKPSLLFTRMVKTSSKKGDLVLDPFCGCGTALDAAQALNRKWIGIDNSIVAMDVIQHRLKDRYGLKITKDYEIEGLPKNLQDVKNLANDETKASIFSYWAATRLDITPSKSADTEADIILWSLKDKKRSDVRLAAEVKTGKPSIEQVRQLQKLIENDKADMCLLITLEPVTSEMREIAEKMDKFKYKGLSFPSLQFWQITDDYFKSPDSIYDELQIPGKLRVKPKNRSERLFPDIKLDLDMK